MIGRIAVGIILSFAAGALAQVSSTVNITLSAPPTTAPTTAPATQPVSVLGPGTRVSFSFKETPAKKAFEELAKLSKLKLSPQPANALDGAAPITLEATDMPWLEAVVRMAKQASVRVHQFGDNWTLMPGMDPRMNGPSASVGPLMFTIMSISVESEVRYGEINRFSRTLSLNGTLYTEPGLAQSNLLVALRASGTDNEGRPVTSRTSSASIVPGFQNRRDFGLALVVPDERTTRLDTLDVVFLLEQIDESAELKIDDLLTPGSSGSIRKTTFTVKDVKPQAASQYTVTLEVKGSDFPAETLTQLQRLPVQPRVTEGSRAAMATNVTGYRQTGSTSQISLIVRLMAKEPRNNAEPDEKAAKPKLSLSWRLPVSFRRVEAPVQFKNIPIPQ